MGELAAVDDADGAVLHAELGCSRLNHSTARPPIAVYFQGHAARPPPTPDQHASFGSMTFGAPAHQHAITRSISQRRKHPPLPTSTVPAWDALMSLRAAN